MKNKKLLSKLALVKLLLSNEYGYKEEDFRIIDSLLKDMSVNDLGKYADYLIESLLQGDKANEIE